MDLVWQPRGDLGSGLPRIGDSPVAVGDLVHLNKSMQFAADSAFDFAQASCGLLCILPRGCSNTRHSRSHWYAQPAAKRTESAQSLRPSHGAVLEHRAPYIGLYSFFTKRYARAPS